MNIITIEIKFFVIVLLAVVLMFITLLYVFLQINRPSVLEMLLFYLVL